MGVESCSYDEIIVLLTYFLFLLFFNLVTVYDSEILQLVHNKLLETIITCFEESWSTNYID